MRSPCEVAAGDPGRTHLIAEEAVLRDALVAVMLPERRDHVLAPGVGAGRGPAVPDAAGPGFGVEEIIQAPDRADGDEDGGERQAHLEAPAQGRARRVTHLAHAPREAQPARKPTAGQPA